MFIFLIFFFQKEIETKKRAAREWINYFFPEVLIWREAKGAQPHWGAKAGEPPDPGQCGAACFSSEPREAGRGGRRPPSSPRHRIPFHCCASGRVGLFKGAERCFWARAHGRSWSLLPLSFELRLHYFTEDIESLNSEKCFKCVLAVGIRPYSKSILCPSFGRSIKMPPMSWKDILLCANAKALSWNHLRRETWGYLLSP